MGLIASPTRLRPLPPSLQHPAGATNVLSTLVGVLFIDRWGRRPLLLQGGVQMLLSQAS